MTDPFRSGCRPFNLLGVSTRTRVGANAKTMLQARRPRRVGYPFLNLGSEISSVASPKDTIHTLLYIESYIRFQFPISFVRYLVATDCCTGLRLFRSAFCIHPSITDKDKHKSTASSATTNSSKPMPWQDSNPEWTERR